MTQNKKTTADRRREWRRQKRNLTRDSCQDVIHNTHLRQNPAAGLAVIALALVDLAAAIDRETE